MNKKIAVAALILIIVVLGAVAYWQYGKNVNPSITLVYPNGGETLKEGSVYTIKWETKNVPASDKISVTIRRVAPPALPEEGQEFDPIVFTDLENTGSKDWTVSYMYPDGNYIIGITAYESLPITNPISDESDATFEIMNAPVAQANYVCNDNKTMQASFYKGETQTVAPGEMPISSGSVKLVLSDGRSFDLQQTISADGSRYANGDESFVFWSKGNGALVLENNVEKSYIGCVVVASDPDGLPNVYHDGTIVFSIRYPADYTINKDYKYQELGPGKEISGVKFTIPSSMTAGTNLGQDSGVSVETIPSTQDCSASIFLYNNSVSQIVDENGTEYSFASSSDAGAGNRYEEYVWAIPGTNPCIAVRYFIHYSAIENYPEGAVSEFDRASLLNQFEKIRESLIVQ
jgi:membrane-bound inhibitor of C-type lysozyme